jgi:hypothetical protein
VKNRFWLFVIIAAIIVIGLIAVVANGASNAKQKSEQPVGLCVVEVRAEIGVDYIKVSNLNTGTSIMLTSLDLPYKFNVTTSDTIRATAYTEPDYLFNCWTFNTGTFDDHNPLTKTVEDKTFVMTANVLYAPTPSPTPTSQVIE